MLKCKECALEYFNGALFCKNCGATLADNESENQSSSGLTTKESSNGFGRTHSSDFFSSLRDVTKRMVFVIPSSGRQVEIELDKTIKVGRTDTMHEIDPELDLTEYQGVEHGVSREHALLEPGTQGISLIDLGSTNGTHLNSRRLPPNEPYFLDNGDTIKFGRLLVRIFFEQ